MMLCLRLPRLNDGLPGIQVKLLGVVFFAFPPSFPLRRLRRGLPVPSILEPFFVQRGLPVVRSIFDGWVVTRCGGKNIKGACTPLAGQIYLGTLLN